MKKYFSLGLCVVFSLMMSTAVLAADPTIERGTPLIDGQVDDVWENVQANPIANSIPVPEGLPIESDDDLSGTWKALWDDEHFYILYEIKDDDRVRINWDEEANAGQNHWDDSVELYLATSGPNAEYSNFR